MNKLFLGLVVAVLVAGTANAAGQQQMSTFCVSAITSPTSTLAVQEAQALDCIENAKLNSNSTQVSACQAQLSQIHNQIVNQVQFCIGQSNLKVVHEAV